MSLSQFIGKIFGKQPSEKEPAILFPGSLTARQFSSLNSDRRMETAMKIGDAADEKYYAFLKWCVLNDPDSGVQFAALKRLTNFSEQKDLPAFLQQLDQSGNSSDFEPYITMALYRVGLLSDEEMKARLNGG